MMACPSPAPLGHDHDGSTGKPRDSDPSLRCCYLEHLEPCRTYDIVGRTTMSLYTDIGTTDLRYRRSPKQLRYRIPILTIDIVVLTFDVVEPDIAENAILKSKNFDIGGIRYRRNYDIERQNFDIHISRYRSSYDIGIDIGIEYGRAHHPALQAVRRCTGHEY